MSLWPCAVETQIPGMGIMARSLGGAVGGLVATVAMTAVMAGAQRAGLLGKMPPRKIVDSLVGRATGRKPRPATSKPLAALAHLGFGAAVGAGYGALARKRRPLAGAAARGLGYATLVWLVSYGGWVPALRIMPPPTRDRPDRQATMVAAHLVYGAVLGALVRRA